MEMPLPEMPALAALHRQYEARGLATLAVSMRLVPHAAVAGFAGRRGLPFGVVIDKRGTVARRYVGEPDVTALRSLLETLRAENPAGA
jgi:peroxiredoxin